MYGMNTLKSIIDEIENISPASNNISGFIMPIISTDKAVIFFFEEILNIIPQSRTNNTAHALLKAVGFELLNSA